MTRAATRRHVRVLVAALVLSVAPCTAAPADLDDESVRHAAETVYSDRSIQTEIPGLDEPIAAGTERRASSSDNSFIESLFIFGFTATGKLLALLVWLAALAGLAFAVFWLVENTPLLLKTRRTEGGEETGPTPAGKDDGGEFRDALGFADELAAAREFGEAIHVLFLYSLAKMRSRLDTLIADSLTSREILGKVPMPEAGRHALGVMVGQVETTHFGDRVATETDYRNCRNSFASFSRALGLEQ